jgi:hypothetical protein
MNCYKEIDQLEVEDIIAYRDYLEKKHLDFLEKVKNQQKIKPKSSYEKKIFIDKDSFL